LAGRQLGPALDGVEVPVGQRRVVTHLLETRADLSPAEPGLPQLVEKALVGEARPETPFELARDRRGVARGPGRRDAPLLLAPPGRRRQRDGDEHDDNTRQREPGSHHPRIGSVGVIVLRRNKIDHTERAGATGRSIGPGDGLRRPGRSADRPPDDAARVRHVAPRGAPPLASGAAVCPGRSGPYTFRPEETAGGSGSVAGRASDVEPGNGDVRAAGRVMVAATLLRPGALELREVPAPEPGPGELVVRVEAALTCGTDVKTFQRGHPKFPLPASLGHE